MNFDEWRGILRDEIQEEDRYIDYHNGCWKLSKRQTAWRQFEARIFDDHLEVFKSCAIEVLSEIDPQFDLEPDQRYAAKIYGKVLKYSQNLRKGIAETLTLLGNEADALKNCSPGKANITAILVVRELFEKNDWRIWASINDLLPTIAEAAPAEFLAAVQKALQGEHSPFDELFHQEGKGAFGRTYLSGLLWALEGLAWSKDYLVRVATLLADLAARDLGGQWSNRPDNSLVSILLPWHRQTLAPFEKHIACLRAVQHDHPDIAWRVLMRLLPNQHQTTSGTHKPSWFMQVPDDWTPTVTHVEYREQVIQYSEMAVKMACADLDRLTELVGLLDNLPSTALDMVIDYLTSNEIRSLNEEDRLPIWLNLIRFSRKHRKFQEAAWALPLKVIERLEKVTVPLTPESPQLKYQYLFTDADSELYEEYENLEEQAQKLEEKRQQAILEIWKTSSLNGVLAFAELIATPYQVGWAFAGIADTDAESKILPYLFAKNEKTDKFLDGYVSNRYRSLGSDWLVQLTVKHWNTEQRNQLLLRLPFNKETWKLTSVWLEENELIYWKQVNVHPYFDKQELIHAIDKLLKYGRPVAALNCLYARLHEKLPLDHARTTSALLAAVSSDEPSNTMDQYYVIELIKTLQEDPNTDPNDLFQIEWAYMALLDGNEEVRPKLLEKKLATEPDLFCEVIQLIYQSEGTEKPETVDNETLAITTNAWRLLHEWKRPPGLREDGSFSAKKFNVWFEKVKERCGDSGHLDVAMHKIGEVLFYSPEDPDGLWINTEIAKQLNTSDTESIRNGFQTEAFNSRGVHWIDPTGAPEKELAQQWREKAEAVEQAGFARFGATLRGLADSYNQEAKRVQLRQKQ